MDWADTDFSLSILSNYRKYQYSLISKYIGKIILEVGSGDRGFTYLLAKSSNNFEKILSIEPSQILFSSYNNKYSFPDNVKFQEIDLFDLHVDNSVCFDTIIFIHVLEHIEKDREALYKAYELLQPNGYVLIEVPALQFLFSPHDKLLGHYRRYTKRTLKAIIDPDKFVIEDIWYQDPLGILGSLYYFKFKKIELKSEIGLDLVKNQGKIYDKYLVPLQSFIGKYIRLPFGLNLTAVLKKVA
jgi:SAM-dependent methyltransferase